MSLADKNKGFTLLEVLIAVFVLAIGLLGLAHLQITSLKNNHSAFLRSQATTFASDIFDRMRANQAEAIAGTYTIALTDDSTSGGTTLAGLDKNDWLGMLEAKLPNGEATITCNDADTTDGAGNPCSSGSIFTITVSWTESNEDGAKATNSFVYEGAL